MATLYSVVNISILLSSLIGIFIGVIVLALIDSIAGVIIVFMSAVFKLSLSHIFKKEWNKK